MKAVVFDFDGPIFDGRSACRSALEATFAEYGERLGTPQLEPETVPLYNPEQLVALAYAEFKISRENLKEILQFYQDRLQQEERKVRVDIIIQKLIKLLRGRGCKLAIVSSRETENLKGAVKRLGLFDYFDTVQGREPDTDSKADTIRRFVADNELDFNEIIFVGDSDRDCDAANKTGIRYYHTTWSGEPTSKAYLNADVRLDSPQDLVAVFSDLAAPDGMTDGGFPAGLRVAVRSGQFSFYAGAGVSVPSGVGGWDSHYVPILRDLGAGALLASYQLPELLQLLASDGRRATEVFDKFAASFRLKQEPNSYHYAILHSGAEHVWTTNYDNLFEQVLAPGDYPYMVVKNDEELKNNFGNQPLIIKMNGDFASAKYDDKLDWEMVFLQEQFDLADKRRTEIWRLFEDDYRNKAIIFVGVSFRDPTLRRVTAAAARSIPRTRYRHCLLMHLPKHPVEIAEFNLFKSYLARYYIDVLGFHRFEDIDRFVRQIAMVAKRPIVGFSGTTTKDNDPAKSLRGGSINSEVISGLCTQLGRGLAERGMRVTSGHGPGVGVPAVEAAFETDPTSARFYLRRRGSSSFSRTAPAIVVKAEHLDTMRERFIPECDLLFAVGGDSVEGGTSGTVSEIERALALQIPVLILKQAGGDAGAYADAYLAKIDGGYADKSFAAQIRKANEALRSVPPDRLEEFFALPLPDLIEGLIAAFAGSSTRRPRTPEDQQW